MEKRKIRVRPEKEAKINQIKDMTEKSKVIILTDYRGLKVSEVMELKGRLREVQGEYRVVKNTLTNLAISKDDYAGINAMLSGPTAILFGYGDPVAPVKVIYEFSKEIERPQIKGGWIEKEFFGPEKIITLAKLPAKNVLITQAVRSIASPLTGLVNVLHGPLRKIVYVLNSIKDSPRTSK